MPCANPNNLQNLIQLHLQLLVVPTCRHATIMILTPLIMLMIVAAPWNATTHSVALAVILAVVTVMMMINVVITSCPCVDNNYIMHDSPPSSPSEDSASHSDGPNCMEWDINPATNPNHPVHFDSHEKKNPITATFCIAPYLDDDLDKSSYIGEKPTSNAPPPLMFITILIPKPRNTATGITPKRTSWVSWTSCSQILSLGT